MAKQYKDDKIKVIERDIDKIRNRPSMYLSALGFPGCLHACKEIIDNNRDECLKKESPGNMIHVEIFKDHIHTWDNGRGIPLDMLQVVFETNQAGSNMTRSGGSTSGENGTGTTLITAVASKLIVTSYRPQEKMSLTLVYEEGKLIESSTKPCNGDKHGLEMTFYPSKKILGVKTIPVDDLVEWIMDMDYTLPKGIDLIYEYNGETHKVAHKELIDYLDDVIPNMDDPKISKFMCAPLKLNVGGELMEEFDEWSEKRHFEVECVLIYTNPAIRDDDIRKSWMNMIYTSLNGVHVDGVVNGYIKAIREAVIKKKKSLENENIRKDILSHLQVVVRATCDFAHMFESQGKHNVYPIPLGDAIRDAIYNAICEMPLSKLDEYVDIVIANNRVRKAGEQARDINKQTKTKQWDKPTSYIPCSTIKTPEPKELFLCEGLSAGGGIRGGRDARYQAILQFRGKNLNIWDVDLDRAMQSEPWLNLVKILGCGIGPTFDIKKLKFDKIIITTDADIDGLHIRVQFCSFFLKYMPEIIEAGKLYIAEPPLYELSGSKRDAIYVATQQEYIQVCIDSIGAMEIEFPEAV